MPWGGLAVKPDVRAGKTTMKMIRSTSMTSIIGTTLGSLLTAPPPLTDIAIVSSPRVVNDRSGNRVVGGGLRVEFTREPRPAELARHALDEVVDHFLRRIRHLGREVVDLRREVVVEPHRRNGHD